MLTTLLRVNINPLRGQQLSLLAPQKVGQDSLPQHLPSSLIAGPHAQRTACKLCWLIIYANQIGIEMLTSGRKFADFVEGKALSTAKLSVNSFLGNDFNRDFHAYPFHKPTPTLRLPTQIQFRAF
jgi:hypothetical protein